MGVETICETLGKTKGWPSAALPDLVDLQLPPAAGSGEECWYSLVFFSTWIFASHSGSSSLTFLPSSPATSKHIKGCAWLLPPQCLLMTVNQLVCVVFLHIDFL